MALDVEMMRLQRISQADAKLLEQIEALDIAGNARLAQLQNNGGADAALYAGADTRWAVWTQREKSALNVQRAELRVKRDVQKQATEKAFGKDEAVRRLAENAQDAAMVKARRV